MIGYRVRHDFHPRLAAWGETAQPRLNLTESVALQYSKAQQDCEPRMTYLVNDDGSLTKTGLRYSVVPYYQETPEYDSDEETLVEGESSDDAALDADIDSVSCKLSEEDRLLMEEFGMTEEEFAEYISDVDSFGTANSNRNSTASTLVEHDEAEGDDDDHQSVIEIEYDDWAPVVDTIEILPEDLSPVIVDQVTEAEVPLEIVVSSSSGWASIEYVEDISMVSEPPSAPAELSEAPRRVALKRLAHKVGKKLRIGSAFRKVNEWMKLSKRTKH